MNCSNENIDVIVKYDDFLQDNIEEMFKQVCCLLSIFLT